MVRREEVLARVFISLETFLLQVVVLREVKEREPIFCETDFFEFVLKRNSRYIYFFKSKQDQE